MSQSIENLKINSNISQYIVTNIVDQLKNMISEYDKLKVSRGSVDETTVFMTQPSIQESLDKLISLINHMRYLNIININISENNSDIDLYIAKSMREIYGIDASPLVDVESRRVGSISLPYDMIIKVNDYINTDVISKKDIIEVSVDDDLASNYIRTIYDMINTNGKTLYDIEMYMKSIDYEVVYKIITSLNYSDNVACSIVNDVSNGECCPICFSMKLWDKMHTKGSKCDNCKVF